MVKKKHPKYIHRVSFSSKNHRGTHMIVALVYSNIRKYRTESEMKGLEELLLKSWPSHSLLIQSIYTVKNK